MSVSSVGVFAFDPVFQASRADPIALVVGTGLVTGDASGGVQVISWTFPTDFAYVFGWISGEADLTADSVMRFIIRSGMTIGGRENAIVDGAGVPVSNNRVSRVFVPPKSLFRPEANLTVDVDVPNTNTIQLRGSLRALIFNHSVLRDAAFIELQSYLL